MGSMSGVTLDLGGDSLMGQGHIRSTIQNACVYAMSSYDEYIPEAEPLALQCTWAGCMILRMDARG